METSVKKCYFFFRNYLSIPETCIPFGVRLEIVFYFDFVFHISFYISLSCVGLFVLFHTMYYLSRNCLINSGILSFHDILDCFFLILLKLPVSSILTELFVVCFSGVTILTSFTVLCFLLIVFSELVLWQCFLVYPWLCFLLFFLEMSFL